MADRVRGGFRGGVALLVVVVALAALWLVPMFTAPTLGDEPFPGADARAAEIVEETGYVPWFSPLFEPSGEVASGLFALQAGIGSAVLFYVLGRLHGRRIAERDREAPTVDGR